MANVTKIVKTTETLTGYNLELTVDEAQFLTDILARICGDDLESRRRYCNTLLRVLEKAGLVYNTSDLYGTLYCG